MGEIGKVIESALVEAADVQAQTAIISKEVDPELAGQLMKTDSHDSRVELLLTAILKELKIISGSKI